MLVSFLHIKKLIKKNFCSFIPPCSSSGLLCKDAFLFCWFSLYVCVCPVCMYVWAHACKTPIILKLYMLPQQKSTVSLTWMNNNLPFWVHWVCDLAPPHWSLRAVYNWNEWIGIIFFFVLNFALWNTHSTHTHTHRRFFFFFFPYFCLFFRTALPPHNVNFMSWISRPQFCHHRFTFCTILYAREKIGFHLLDKENKRRWKPSEKHTPRNSSVGVIVV